MPADAQAGSAQASRRSGAAPWLRRAFYAAVVLALMPAVLTFLYLPSFVHPVSTLMLKDLVDLPGLRPPLGAARRHRAGAGRIR